MIRPASLPPSGRSSTKRQPFEPLRNVQQGNQVLATRRHQFRRDYTKGLLGFAPSVSPRRNLLRYRPSPGGLIRALSPARRHGVSVAPEALPARVGQAPRPAPPRRSPGPWRPRRAARPLLKRMSPRWARRPDGQTICRRLRGPRPPFPGRLHRRSRRRQSGPLFCLLAGRVSTVIARVKFCSRLRRAG